MTQTLRARGAFPAFTRGRIRFEILSYVLTASKEDLESGRRRLSGQRYTQTLDFNGSIKIYHLGPEEIEPVLGFFDLGNSGDVRYVSTDPFGAFDDFAIFTHDAGYQASDPVDGFVISDNLGAISGNVGDDWTQHKRVFIPPKGTKFVVPHPVLRGVPAGGSQYLDAFQTEVLRTDQTDVTEYQEPRALEILVRPDRINLSENPSGAIDSEAWFGADKVANGLQIDGSGYHYVSGLRPGEWYVKSVYVDGPQRVTLDGAEQISEQAGTERRLWVVFKATDTWCSLDLTSSGIFTARKAMVEPTRVIRPYFDGDSGTDYLWEEGKQPGAGRSYFYSDRTQRHYILQRTLQENVPIGVSVLDPIYGRGTEVSRNYGFGIGAYGLTNYGE